MRRFIVIAKNERKWNIYSLLLAAWKCLTKFDLAILTLYPTTCNMITFQVFSANVVLNFVQVSQYYRVRRIIGSKYVMRGSDFCFNTRNCCSQFSTPKEVPQILWARFFSWKWVLPFFYFSTSLGLVRMKICCDFVQQFLFNLKNESIKNESTFPLLSEINII